MYLRKWNLAFICTFVATSVAGGFWLWHITKPAPRVWLRVYSLKVETGSSSKVDLEAWVPAGPDVTRLATQAFNEMRAKQWAVCGNYFGASLTFVEQPPGGYFQTHLSPAWPSTFLQSASKKRVFAATWVRENDGAIRVVTSDPLFLERLEPKKPIPENQDLWVEVEVPKRGELKAVALAERRADGSYRAITF